MKNITQGSLFYLDPFQREYIALRRVGAFLRRFCTGLGGTKR